MALFKNAATEWEKTMTENDLDQMEAQGLDVSKYREKLAARRARRPKKPSETGNCTRTRHSLTR